MIEHLPPKPLLSNTSPSSPPSILKSQDQGRLEVTSPTKNQQGANPITCPKVIPNPQYTFSQTSNLIIPNMNRYIPGVQIRDIRFRQVKYNLEVLRHSAKIQRWHTLYLSLPHLPDLWELHSLTLYFSEPDDALWRAMEDFYRHKLPDLCSSHVRPELRVQFIHYEMLLGRFGFDKATYCPFEAQLSFDLFFGRNFVERRRRDAREARELVGRYYPGGLMARCLIARVRERRWEEEAEDCVERWREMVRERLITRGQMGSWVDRLYWSRPEFR